GGASAFLPGALPGRRAAILRARRRPVAATLAVAMLAAALPVETARPPQQDGLRLVGNGRVDCRRLGRVCGRIDGKFVGNGSGAGLRLCRAFLATPTRDFVATSPQGGGWGFGACAIFANRLSGLRRHLLRKGGGGSVRAHGSRCRFQWRI